MTASTVIFALGMLTCCFASDWGLSGILALLLFCIYLISVLVKQPHQLFKYLPFYFGAFVNVAGCAVCEYSGIYLSELGVYASFVGSLPFLVLSQWLFLTILSLYDQRFGVEREQVIDKYRDVNKYLRIGSMCVFLMVLIMFASVAMTPAFLQGLDRFQYADQIPKIATRLASWMGFLIVLPMIDVKRTHSKVGIAAILLYVLYGLWVGEKFGLFYALLYMVIIVYYDKIMEIDRKKLSRRCVWLGAALLLLVGIAVGLNSATNSQDRGDYVFQRLAQQGQLWWKNYDASEGVVHLDQIEHEFSGLVAPVEISDNVGSNYGIYGSMYRAAPKSVVDNKLAAGSRYTEGGYASVYYCVGPVGALVFEFFAGLLVAFFTNCMIRAVITGRLIETVLLLRLRGFLMVALSMGSYQLLLSRLSLLTYCFLLVIWLMRRNSSFCIVRKPNTKEEDYRYDPQLYKVVVI